MHAWKNLTSGSSGYFPNAFNSTEDMKYCAESSGKPTINGMKIPSVNDWAHETVWVIKMLCRTELKIFTGLSVRYCLKDVLGLDSSSNTECRHCSELLLRMEGGRYMCQPVFCFPPFLCLLFQLRGALHSLFISSQEVCRSIDWMSGDFCLFVWLLWFVF